MRGGPGGNVLGDGGRAHCSLEESRVLPESSCHRAPLGTGTLGAKVGRRGSGRPGSPGAGLPHPLGLLQLLRQLLQGRRMSLPHVLDLSFMVLSFFLKSFLQLCHFLLTFCTRETYFRTQN